MWIHDRDSEDAADGLLCEGPKGASNGGSPSPVTVAEAGPFRLGLCAGPVNRPFAAADEDPLRGDAELA